MLAQPHLRILDFIYRYTHEFGYPPTLQEIAEECGWNSRQAVWPHVRWLVEHGYLRSRRGHVRSLVLTERGKAELL